MGTFVEINLEEQDNNSSTLWYRTYRFIDLIFGHDDLDIQNEDFC